MGNIPCRACILRACKRVPQLHAPPASFPPWPSASTFQLPNRATPNVGPRQAAMAIPNPSTLSGRNPPLHLGKIATWSVGDSLQMRLGCRCGFALLRCRRVWSNMTIQSCNPFTLVALRDSALRHSIFFQGLMHSAGATHLFLSSCGFGQLKASP